MAHIRISLSEKDFKTLISGGVLSQTHDNQVIQICLQDIGFYNMEQIVINAINHDLKEKAKSPNA